MTLLFDAAGMIAGVQSVLLKTALAGSTMPFDKTPVYQEGKFFGEDAWFTTAYFVDPEIICTVGRAGAAEDAGDRLWVQIGETPENFVKVPLTRAEADSTLVATEGWFAHYCFPGMGVHYIQFNYQDTQKCEEVLPLQILYSDGKLVGFVWQHIGLLPGDRWEHPGIGGMAKIVQSPPTCLETAAETPGLSTMHVYFSDYPQLTFCSYTDLFNIIF